jgi:hypothetical protein
MAKRVIPKQWVDMATGQLTLQAIEYLNDLDNGASNSINSVGTVLAGVNATQLAIIAGTQPLVDVLIESVGSVAGNVAALNANTNAASVAASTGALTATVSPSSASKFQATPGTLTTGAVVVTPSGGTGPYMYAWAKVTGDTFTVNSPTGASTTFSVTLALDEDAAAQYRCTVTDSLAATFTVDVAVTARVTSAS